MKNNVVFVILISLTMITGFIVGAVGKITINTTFDENDADLPVWNVGDSWTYEMTIDGGTDTFGLRNLKLENMIYTVEEVQLEKYKLVVSSDIEGSLALTSPPITVSFTDTHFEGIAYVNKSTLSIEKIDEIEIDGKVISIPFVATGLVNMTYFGNVLPLMFPINVDDNWIVDLMSIDLSIAHGVSIPLLDIPDPLELHFYVGEHEVICDGWDVVNAGGTEYHALYLKSPNFGNRHDIWYSPAAGNVVKVVNRKMPLGAWGDYDVDVELKSTTYSYPTEPPLTPGKPSGPTSLAVGTSSSYTTNTTDPDEHKVRYGWDWNSDGTVDEWTGFYNSGDDVSTTHTWTEEGTHSLRVKARDKYGGESGWSEPLEVEVLNEAPLKPATPDGPLQGKIKKQSYTYTTSTTDPDGHMVKYGWDWDGNGNVDEWTNLFESGDEASGSNTWNTKGDYFIKVKARDEYGAESEWSDPLPVSMPRSRNLIQFKFIDLLDRILEKFPIFEQILGFF